MCGPPKSVDPFPKGGTVTVDASVWLQIELPQTPACKSIILCLRDSQPDLSPRLNQEK